MQKWLLTGCVAALTAAQTGGTFAQTADQPRPAIRLSDKFSRLAAPGTGRPAVQLTSGKAACYPLYYFIPSISRDGKYLVYHRCENKTVQLWRLNLETAESVPLTHADGRNADWRPWQAEQGLRGILDYRSALNVARNQVLYFDGNKLHAVDLETLKDGLLFEIPADREPIGQNCTTPDGKWFVYIHAPAGSARPKPCKGAVVAAYNFDTKEQRVLCTIDSPIHHVLPFDNEHFLVNHPAGHDGMIFTDLTSGKWSELRRDDPGAKGYSCHQLSTACGVAYEVFKGGPSIISGLYDPFTRRRFEFCLSKDFGYTHTGWDPEGRLWFWEQTSRKLGHSLWYLEKLNAKTGGVFIPLTGDWPIAAKNQRGHMHPALTPDRRWLLITGGDADKTPQLFLLDISDLKPPEGVSTSLLSATGENDVLVPGTIAGAGQVSTAPATR
jgi:hypothetical protein